MKKQLIAVFLLTTGSLCCGAALAADSENDPWHASVFGGKALLDSDRPTNNGDFFGIGIGRWFTDNLTFDIEYEDMSADVDAVALNNFIPGATFDEWSIDSYNVIGRYYFREPGTGRPYVLFGPGYSRHRSIFSQSWEYNFSLGAGLQGPISENFDGRFQVAYRWNHDNDSIPTESSFNDVFVSLGVVGNWGGSSAPPPPPPAEPPGDADGDGVTDDRDRCPNTPRGAEVDQYGCHDSDNDGVPNSRDKCPNTRAGAVVDLDGCEVEAVIDLPGVYFDFDRATLRPEGKQVLDDAAELLNSNTRVMVEVAGHTDSVGSEAYNQQLSERRANTVKDYLTSKGVTASRLTARGYGESRPVATNDTKEGRQLNRRTELVVMDR